MDNIKVSINGIVSDGASASVSALDRGFLYGDSVFEVFRTYDGVPFTQQEHLERLVRSAERLMIPMPVGLDQLSDEIRKVVAASGLDNAYVRVVVTRGTGPLTYDPTTAKEPLRVVIVAPIALRDPRLDEEGARVILVHASRPTDDERAQGAKASNYLANLLVVHEAKQRGAHEAILLGKEGQLLEGASSNIFIVKGRSVRTPTPQPGILVGITRAVVLQLARDAGFDVEEATLFPDDLFTADEAFITSSIREVLPVVMADDRPIGPGEPGPVTKALRAGFRDFVRDHTARFDPTKTTE